MMTQDQRRWSVFLLRIFVGAILFTAGLGKFLDPGPFQFVNYILDQMSDTFLPGFLLSLYGYLLPWVELVLGVTLLVGLCRHTSFVLAALTFISLSVGQMLLGEGAMAANIGIYVLCCVAGIGLLDRPCLAFDSLTAGKEEPH